MSDDSHGARRQRALVRLGWRAGALLVVVGALGCRSARPAFYPVGIYGVADARHLGMVREAGFNVVAGAADRAFLESAGRAGLKVLASAGSLAGAGFNAAAAARVVATADGHPALWAWYVSDEPDLNRVSPAAVEAARRALVKAGARKPVAVAVSSGAAGLDYAGSCDWLMVARYPVAWLPLATFNQQVRQARLAAGRTKPLIAVIQTFDWRVYPEVMSVRDHQRAPTYEELRCMTYGALTEGADGLFYFCFDDGRWRITEHPASWQGVQRVVQEVEERLPLFRAERRWWPVRVRYGSWGEGFNDVLEASVTFTLLEVRKGNWLVAPGRYVLAVNTTPREVRPRFASPELRGPTLAVFTENRSLEAQNGCFADTFRPYDIHIYGPLPLP